MTKIKDIKKSNGPQIKDGDIIELYYKVSDSINKYYEGAFIETTYKPDIPITVNYSRNNLLLGVYEGMKDMNSGGSIRLISVPPEKGYGKRNWGGIKANSELIVEICLARIISRNSQLNE